MYGGVIPQQIGMPGLGSPEIYNQMIYGDGSQHYGNGYQGAGPGQYDQAAQ